MHEELITTTSATLKFSGNTIVNSNTLHHQSTNIDDGTLTVSIIHPHQPCSDLADFIGSTSLNVPCSTTNQIVPSQTKINISSNDLHVLKEDVSTVINGTLSNTNDPNVLILPVTETCDNDENPLTISQLTTSQAEQIEIDINSLNDETSSREEGESIKRLF